MEIELHQKPRGELLRVFEKLLHFLLFLLLCVSKISAGTFAKNWKSLFHLTELLFRHAAKKELGDTTESSAATSRLCEVGRFYDRNHGRTKSALQDYFTGLCRVGSAKNKVTK